MKEPAGGAEDPREECERGDIDYVDPKMARVLSHPVRIRILAMLNKRIMSPSGFSKRTGEKLQTVSYHFRILAKYECIEEVETQRVRGSIEHFYQANKRVLFDGKAWNDLPASIKAQASGQAVDDFLGAVTASMEAELFDAHNERMLVWVQKRLDWQGWDEAVEAHRDLVHRMESIFKGSTVRLAEAGESEGGIVGTYGLFLFESPAPEPEKADEEDPDE